MEVYTNDGRQLTLQDPPLKKGAEGAVYRIAGYDHRVAKIYLKEADKRKDKIETMVKFRETVLFQKYINTGDIAWPMASLYDAKGEFIGFGMKCVKSKDELDDLYVYPPKKVIPMKDKIDCLIHLCELVDNIHLAGQGVGDFNPNNIKVSLTDKQVSIVDVDSFCVKWGSKEHKCIVCLPGYVAPELIRKCKGTTYEACKNETFTKETDRFGLAVSIFRMLFNGMHPFYAQAIPPQKGSLPAPQPIDRHVERGETPYFRTVPNHTVSMYAPDMKSMPPYLVEAFRKAFVDGHSDPKARPSADDWKKILMKYRTELNECSHHHAYWKQNKKCPYCEADNRYRQKNMPAPIPKPVPQPTPSNNTTVTPTRVANQGTTLFTRHFSWPFWLITFVIAIGLQLMAHPYMPEVFRFLIDEDPKWDIVVQICTYGSMIAGMIGWFTYNYNWAPGIYTGNHGWLEYIYSVLTSVGFTVLFILAVLVIVIALVILGFILYAAVVILIIGGIIGGLCSG